MPRQGSDSGFVVAQVSAERRLRRILRRLHGLFQVFSLRVRFGNVGEGHEEDLHSIHYRKTAFLPK